MGDDKPAALEARPWVLPSSELVSLLDDLQHLAVEVDAAPPPLGEAVAAGKVNLDQAATIARSIQRLPHDIGSPVRNDAAAALVGYSTDLDPAQLDIVGDRILHLVAPETAEEADRRTLERHEEHTRRDRTLTMTPDPAGGGVRLSGRLPAEAAATIEAAIDPLCKPTPDDDRTPTQRRADALVEVCRLALSTTGSPRKQHGASPATPGSSRWY